MDRRAGLSKYTSSNRLARRVLFGDPQSIADPQRLRYFLDMGGHSVRNGCPRVDGSFGHVRTTPKPDGCAHMTMDPMLFTNVSEALWQGNRPVGL